MTNPVIDIHGNQFYYNGGNQYHRENGPAVIYADGTQYWYKNGRRHRIDGPAVIHASGYTCWYLDDTGYIDNKSFQSVANLTDEDMTAIILKYGNVND
jgi:hypothetical protein